MKFMNRLNEIKDEWLRDPSYKLNELGVLNEPGDVERFVDISFSNRKYYQLDGVGHFLNFYDGIYEEKAMVNGIQQ